MTFARNPNWHPHITVSNPPIPPKPACCEEKGCKNEAQKRWYTAWLCNFHFYVAYRALEMNNDSPEAAA